MTEPVWSEKGKKANPGVGECGRTTWRRLSRGFVTEMKEKMHERRRAMSLPSDELLFIDSDEETSVESSIDEKYRRRKTLEAEITLKVLDGYDTVSESSSRTNSLCFQDAGIPDNDVDKNEINVLSHVSVEDGCSEAESVTYTNSFTESLEEDIECDSSNTGVNDIPELIIDNRPMQYEGTSQIMTTSGIPYDATAKHESSETMRIITSHEEHNDTGTTKHLEPVTEFLSHHYGYVDLIKSRDACQDEHDVLNVKPLDPASNKEAALVREEEDKQSDDKTEPRNEIADSRDVDNMRSTMNNDNVDDVSLPRNKGDIPENISLSLDRGDFIERPKTDIVQNVSEPDIFAGSDSSASKTKISENSVTYSNMLSESDSKLETVFDEKEQGLDEFVECLTGVLTNDTVVDLEQFDEICTQRLEEFNNAEFHNDACIQNISCNKGSPSTESMASRKPNTASTKTTTSLMTTRRKMLLKDTINLPLQKCIEKARLVTSIKVTMDKTRTLADRLAAKAAYDKAIKDFMEAVDNLLIDRQHQEDKEPNPSSNEKTYSADDIQLQEKVNSNPADIIRTPIPRRRSSVLPNKLETNYTTLQCKNITDITELSFSGDEKSQGLSRLNMGKAVILLDRSEDRGGDVNTTNHDTDSPSGNKEFTPDVEKLETKKKSRRRCQKNINDSSDKVSTFKYREEENNDDPDLHFLIELNKPFFAEKTDDFKNMDVVWENDNIMPFDIDVLLKQNDEMYGSKTEIEDREATFVIDMVAEEHKEDKTFQIDNVVAVEKLNENTFRIDKNSQDMSSEDQATSLSEDETLNVVASICNNEFFDDDLTGEKGNSSQEEDPCHDVPTNASANGTDPNCFLEIPCEENVSYEKYTEFLAPLDVIDEVGESLIHDTDDKLKIKYQALFCQTSLNPGLIGTIGDPSISPTSYTGSQKAPTQSSTLEDNQINKETDLVQLSHSNEPGRIKQFENARTNTLRRSLKDNEYFLDPYSKVHQEIACSPVDIQYENDTNGRRGEMVENCPDDMEMTGSAMKNYVCNEDLNLMVRMLKADRSPNRNTDKSNFITESLSATSSTSGEYSLRLPGIDGHCQNIWTSAQLHQDAADEEARQELNKPGQGSKGVQFKLSPIEMLTREKSADDVVEMVCLEYQTFHQISNDCVPFLKCPEIFEDKEPLSERTDGLRIDNDNASVNSMGGRTVSETSSKLRKKVAFFEHMESTLKRPTTCRLPLQIDDNEFHMTQLSKAKCLECDTEPYELMPNMNSQIHHAHVSKHTNTPAMQVEDAAVQVDERTFINDVEPQNSCIQNASQTCGMCDCPYVVDIAEDLKCQVSETNKLVETMQYITDDALQAARQERQLIQYSVDSLSDQVNPHETLIMDKLYNIEKSIDSVRKSSSDFDAINDSLDQLKCANVETATSLKHFVSDTVGKLKQNVEDGVQKLSIDVQEQIILMHNVLEKLQESKLGQSSRSCEDSREEQENLHALRMRVVELKSQRDAEKMYHKITRESLRALERDHDRLRQEILLAPNKRRQEDSRRKSSHLQMVINETLQSKIADLDLLPFTSTPIKSKGSPQSSRRKERKVTSGDKTPDKTVKEEQTSKQQSSSKGNESGVTSPKNDE